MPEEAPDFIFGPAIGTYADVVAFRKGEAINPDQITGQNTLRLGAINGYEYYGAVNEYLETHANDSSLVQYMSGDDALTKNLRKLTAGRLDMVAEVRAVLTYALAETGLTEEVEMVLTDTSNDIFIAFSPVLSTSQNYADQLSEGVERMKEDGRFDQILAKYGQGVENP